jgi:hypothetical protein
MTFKVVSGPLKCSVVFQNPGNNWTFKNAKKSSVLFAIKLEKLGSLKDRDFILLYEYMHSLNYLL